MSNSRLVREDPIPPTYFGLTPISTAGRKRTKSRKKQAKAIQEHVFVNNDKYKWKIVQLQFQTENSPDRWIESEKQMCRLEQVISTMMIQTCLQLDAYLTYECTLVLGAENVAVTTHYLHQIAIAHKVSLKTNNNPKHLADLVEEVFAKLRYDYCQVLVIFSNAKEYSNAEVTDYGIYAFVPIDTDRVDFMVLVMDIVLCEFLKNLGSYPRAATTADKFTCLKQSCCFKKCVQETAILEAEDKPLKNLKQFMDAHNHDVTEAERITKLLAILSLLYPNNISKEFIDAVIKHHWKNDQVTSKWMLAKVKKLISKEILRKVDMDGLNFPVYSFKRSLQMFIREEFYESIVFGDSKMGRAGKALIDFFQSVDAKIAADKLDLFSGIGDDKDGHFLITEVAMHESWVYSHAYTDCFRLTFAKRVNPPLMERVTNYVHTRTKVGSILVCQQDVLGEDIYQGFLQRSDRKTREAVAVKCLRNTDMRFMDKEIKKLLELNSPYLARYLHQETDGMFTYIAMLPCDKTLKKWVEEQGEKTFSEDLQDLVQRFQFIRDILYGINDLHHRGIIHGDLKPDNIFLKTDGAGPATTATAMIAGYGLSKLVRREAVPYTASTHGVGGTLLYMAPEAVTGNTTFATDMYSFGKVCYFVLSGGIQPFQTFDDLKPFNFDFYGVAEALEALVSEDASKRPTATQLLKHPMFWIVEEEQRRFADFIMNLSIDFNFGKEGNNKSPFHIKMSEIQLDWKNGLKAYYIGQNVEAVIYYRPNAKSKKRAAAKKSNEEAFSADAAGYLRFCRNALAHAIEHKNEAKLAFVKLYFDNNSKAPNRWKFFETYFKPFEDLFYKVWEIARDPVLKVPVNGPSDGLQ